jgi:hypothetical protein
MTVCFSNMPVATLRLHEIVGCTMRTKTAQHTDFVVRMAHPTVASLHLRLLLLP